MEKAWHNRLTRQPCQKPEEIPFLGLWHSKDGSAWPGTQQDLEQPGPASEPSEILRQSLTSLATAIRKVLGQDWRRWANLVPLDPTITSELNLRDSEKALIKALPHLETLCHNPRSHLTIEEIREQVGRARRISSRAVAALAAHSEDWQTRSFLGVRPKRILAESRQDQWDIYENRAVGTLRKRVLGVLHPRLQWLNHVLKALDESSEHSDAIRGTRFRRDRLYQIWGEIFETHPSRDLLAQLITNLDAARARVLALADSHLFKQMPHFAAVESPLHSTNVFQSDANYRRAFDLWHQWERHVTTKPPTAQERADARRRSVEDWDLFVILLTLRACHQFDLAPTETTAQRVAADQRITLQRGWSLVIQSDRSLMLQHTGTPLLQIVGLYCCLGAQAEKEVEAALQVLHESNTGRHPLLLVTVHDPESPVAPHSTALGDILERLRTTNLLSRGLGLAEVSPLRIDSTELIGRAIHWVTCEREWPRLPIRKHINKDWSRAWPELSANPAIRISGHELQFVNCPPDALITEADNRAQMAKERFENSIEARAHAKQAERRTRGDRRDRADLNLHKKELAAQKTNERDLKEAFDEIRDSLFQIRDDFRILQQCPCCRSKLVVRQEGAMLMTCSDCQSEWGRRTCPGCRETYAFTIPHDATVRYSPDGFDPLRIFGSDMCALLASSKENGFVTRATRCPYCNAVSGD
jgi:hypothetical protein